jgi:squalene-hopene/tetraprenyl-beta-curcumene cyclase
MMISKGLANSEILSPRADRLSQSIESAIDWLRRTQDPSGFWVGMVESNSTIEAEWLLASHIIGFSLSSEAGIIKALLQRQRPDGSWGVYPGAPDGDVNSTVEVYAALRAKRFHPQCDELARARAWIVEHDAIRKIRVFTKYWLAMLGVWPWEHTPNLPFDCQSGSPSASIISRNGLARPSCL